jgi:hypothetical protein
MRETLAFALILLSVSIGLWPGWLGPEWLTLGPGSKPDFWAALIVVLFIGAMILSDRLRGR